MADADDVTRVRNRPQRESRAGELSLRTELDAMRRLHDMTVHAVRATNMKDALEEVLEAALELHGADCGTIRLFHRDDNQARIVAHKGLPQDFVDRRAVIGPNADCACGRALLTLQPCRIEDIAADPSYARDPEMMARAGFRSVQSIPLIDRTDELVGVLSTHFLEPHEYSDRDKQLGDLLARQAADLIASREHQEQLAELNRKLEKRNAELADQNRKKEDFLAVLGHELRNPMAAIHSSLELITPSDEQANRALAVLRRQSQHLIRLVNDLLDITRINHGKFELKRRIVDLRQLIREAAEPVRGRADALGLRLDVDLPAEPIYVDGDPERLSQVLDNLLRNAVSYTEHGRIAITARRGSDQARVAVHDTGAGLEKTECAAIFEPYYQTESGKRSGGLGLGLTLVKGIVERHGGTVQVHSAGRGTGSEFIFTLPLSKSVPDTTGVMTAPKLKSRRILVVDDQPDNADMFAAMLELLGFQVRVAYSGNAALRIAWEQRPEVAFLDLSMPNMDGRELAQRLREMFTATELTLIALTGFGQEQTTAREAGFEHYLLKPATADRVVELLSSLPDREMRKVTYH
jgi:signal transduction histidine kinase/ActR/RegA family two-component response regulator